MPKRQPPAGYTLLQLAERSHLHPRTIRRSIERGLLGPPELRGSSTRYTEDHLVRLRAIYQLRHTERISFAAIRRRLAHLGADEIRQLAAGPAAAVPVPVPREDTWRRVTLAAGLELHVRDDADAGVRELAAEIERRHRRKDS